MNHLEDRHRFWLPMLCLLCLSIGSAPQISDGSQHTTAGAKYPLAVSGILGSATLEPMAAETILVGDNLTITTSELAEKTRAQDPKMHAQLEKNRLFLLEQEVVRRLLLDEAGKSGISISGANANAAIQELFERKLSKLAVTEDEAKTFYQANKEMVGNASFEQVTDEIRAYLLQDKKQQAVAAHIAGLKDSVRLRINEKWLEEQSRLAVDNAVDKARGSGKPSMIEFGATGCVPCDMMQPILENLRKKYPETVNVVFVHVGEEQVLGARYDIQSIPVQVFFDADGKEVFRHVGFFAEVEVTRQLSAMGVAK